MLPWQNQSLRQLAINRKGGLKLNVERRLPLEVELALCKLLRAELQLQQRMRDFRVELASRAGCKIYQLFKLVATAKSEDFKEEQTREFMKRHGIYALGVDSAAVVKRLDRDRDGKVSYMDFLDSLLPFEPPRYAVTAKQPATEPRTRSSLKPQTVAKTRTVSASPGKSILKRSTLPGSAAAGESQSPAGGRTRKPEDEFRPLRVGSVSQVQSEAEAETVRRDEKGFTTPERSALSQSPEYPTTGETPARPQLAGSVTEGLNPAYREGDDHAAKVLSKIFDEQIKLDKETEAARERLCLRPDFTIRDAFNYFDVKRQGSITLYELRIGLDRLKAARGFEDLLQLMKRYDLDRNGSLSYGEFESMLIPRKAYFSELVAKRSSPAGPGEMVFSEETRLLFVSVLQDLMDTEMTMEKLRRKASEDPAIYFEDAFAVCAPDKEGRVAGADINKMMSRRRYFVSDGDVETLMSRYDKDRDARISFPEVCDNLFETLCSSCRN